MGCKYMEIITARTDSIFFSSTAVHIYDFHLFTALGGLFGSNIMTNSQMARYLSWYSTALVFFKYQFINAKIDSIIVSSYA